MKIVLTVLALAAALLAGGCESSPPQPPGAMQDRRIAYEGGDGLSLESAVIVLGGDHFAGIRAEYAWLTQRYPGHRLISQAVLLPKGRFVDRIEIETQDRQRRVIYFDMSAYAPKR